MKAIILAAGRGSRMGKHTDNKPKCLTIIKGKPLLYWQIKAIKKSGISEIAIVTGYKRNLISTYNLIEFYNNDWKKTNMVESLNRASSFLENDNCIVSYADIYYSHEAITSLINSNADLAITYDPNWLNKWKKRFDDPLLDAETFKITEDSHVSEIGRKPSSLQEIKGQYMGLLKFTPFSWNKIRDFKVKYPETLHDKISMTELLQNLITMKILSIKAIPHYKLWGEVDTFSDLMFLKSQIN